jgi:signal transduction histidine kinase
LFVDAFRTPAGATSGLIRRSAATYDVSVLAHRMLGTEEAQRLLQEAGGGGARAGGPADGSAGSIANDAFISLLERRLAGSVGAASAHAMISQVVTGETISLDELIKIADETQRIREYSRRLEQKSQQLEATASQLSAANDRLTRLDAEKDEFLSQVSHEVRTPLTSIRSFAEILVAASDLKSTDADRYLQIIHEESIRLTRLLDSTLDLSLLERGEAPWEPRRLDPELALENAIRTCEGLSVNTRVQLVNGERASGVVVEADADRLSQVFINLISNAIKYNRGASPYVRVSSRLQGGEYEVLVEDNGPGIRADERELIFSKFRRGWAHTQTSEAGAGLGLAISWQIMHRLGGSLTLLPDTGTGACFRVALARCPDAAPA